MATPHTETTSIRRKRTPRPPKSRVELAQEFNALPLVAFAVQAQVAAFLNVSEAKLERDRWAGGGIPYLKQNRSVRYKKADVLAYLEGKTRTSTTAAKG